MDRRTFNLLVGSVVTTAMLKPAELFAPVLASDPSKFVKIGNKPYIVEDTDRWGVPLGTYSVMSAIGWTTQKHWQSLHEFEHYEDFGGKEEMIAACEAIGRGVKFKDIEMPIMRRMVDHSQIRQFNMRLTDPDVDKSNETVHIRCMAFFNEPTLKLWTDADDASLAVLEKQCAKMNGAV
jgi:hypothetical protein